MIELGIYSGVHHGFDNLDLSVVPTRGVTFSSVMFKGHRVEFNQDATKDPIVELLHRLEGYSAVNPASLASLVCLTRSAAKSCAACWGELPTFVRPCLRKPSCTSGRLSTTIVAS